MVRRRKTARARYRPASLVPVARAVPIALHRSSHALEYSIIFIDLARSDAAEQSC